MDLDVPFNRTSADGTPNSVLIRDRRIFGLNFGGIALPTGANTLADGRLRCFGAQTALRTRRVRACSSTPIGNLVPYNPGMNFGTDGCLGR